MTNELTKIKKVTALFGHHKNSFKDISPDMELIFDELDPEYPIYIAPKGTFKNTIISDYFAA